MYTANIQDKRHTFQASGSLWQDALVMQDLETNSLWAQISGEAIDGEQKGETLSLYNNFSHSTFAEFKDTYPHGLLLNKEEIGREGSRYEKYFSDSTKFGIFGRADTFTKLHGKEIVYGFRLDCTDVAVSKPFLILKGYVGFACGDSTIIVIYDKTTDKIQAFNTDYVFNEGYILDKFNKSELQKYKKVPVLTAFWFAWISFYPETELIH